MPHGPADDDIQSALHAAQHPPEPGASLAHDEVLAHPGAWGLMPYPLPMTTNVFLVGWWVLKTAWHGFASVTRQWLGMARTEPAKFFVSLLILASMVYCKYFCFTIFAVCGWMVWKKAKAPQD